MSSSTSPFPRIMPKTAPSGTSWPIYIRNQQPGTSASGQFSIQTQHQSPAGSFTSQTQSRAPAGSLTSKTHHRAVLHSKPTAIHQLERSDLHPKPTATVSEAAPATACACTYCANRNEAGVQVLHFRGE